MVGRASEASRQRGPLVFLVLNIDRGLPLAKPLPGTSP